MLVLRRSPLQWALLAAALLSGPALAEQPLSADLRSLLDKLNARIEKLEQRNAELERQIDKPGAKAIEKRLQALEATQAGIDKGLESDSISQYEPDLTSRLKAVEKDALEMKKAARKIDALDGLRAGASLTTAAQKPYGLPRGTVDGNSQLNYRADIIAELPLEPIGAIDHKLFGHFRIGQGDGLNAPLARLDAFARAPNATAFRASGSPPDDSVAILGEAWYQASIPLPHGGFKPHSRENIDLTFGKMDIFGFFDQNTNAGDESRQFLNSVFVHNPLLDAGGQVGVDANGFQPGFIVAYNNKSRKASTWRLSLGAFGSGSRGANYQRTFSSPLLIAQAETSLKLTDGLAGNYRFYTWRQGQGQDLDGSVAKQSGWGVSADQQVAGGVSVFGRYGRLMQGKVPFNRALTLGLEQNGAAWSRASDAISISAGWLQSSKGFRTSGGSADLDGDGNTDFRYVPNGAERILEIYYRYRVSKQFELSPDFQYISRPGANPDAKAVKVLGLRAQFAF